MDCLGSVYFPEDAHLSPNRFMAQLADHLKKRGTHFQWNTEVTGWRREGDRVTAVSTSRSEFTGDEFVLAGGSWSPMLSRELGLKLPMQAGKGYSLTLQNPAELPELSYIFTEARLAVTPMMGSLRIGGTMEIAGLDTSINPSRVRGIVKSVAPYFPKFPARIFEGIQPWSGLRPCSPDGLPYLGRSSRCQNLTIATGHAMMGLSMGPVSGKLVAEVVNGESPSIPLTLTQPDRYSD